MSVFRDRVFQADYVRALASDSRQEPRREVDAGQQREVVDKSRHLDSFGHGGKVPKECLFAHLPVEGRDDEDTIRTDLFGVAGKLDGLPGTGRIHAYYEGGFSVYYFYDRLGKAFALI